MTKQEILNYFSDINFVYNDSSKHDTLARMLDELLKEQPEIVRCKDCKHLFDGEHTKNCCDVLMEKAGWLKEISVSPDWFCADGERMGKDD